MRVADWFFAARPLLHIPGWSIFLVALHYHHQLALQHFDWRDGAMIFALSLLAAGGFYLNQVTDLESDRINRKCFFLPFGIFQRVHFGAAFVVCSVVAIGLTAITSAVGLLIAIQLFVLMYLYSAYPFRWKDRMLGGLFVNAYGNGFLVAMAVMPELRIDNAGLLGWDNPFYFLFAVGGTYVLTTIPDREGDRLTGKGTLSVRLGQNTSLLAAAALFLFAARVAYTDGRMPLTAIAFIAAALSLVALVVSRRAWLMLAIKAPILALALLAGWFYPEYLGFLVVLVFAARLYYRKRFGMSYPQLAA